MAERSETNESIIQRLKAAAGTPTAAEIMGELWRRNLPIVNKAVRSITGLKEGVDGFEDMRQQAFFGFRAAAYSFNAAAGFKFTTWAYKKIRWELARYYERNGFTVRIPAYIKKRLKDCAKRKSELEAETGKAVTYEAVLSNMGFSPAVIAGTLAAFRKMETTSLDGIYTEGDDGDGATLLDLIASGEDVEEAAIVQEWHRELHAVLMAALQEVPEDTREIIIRRFFVGVSFEKQAAVRSLSKQTIYNRVDAAYTAMRAGKYGADLASFMPTFSELERAREMVRRDREAFERLKLTDEERGLLIL